MADRGTLIYTGVRMAEYSCGVQERYQTRLEAVEAKSRLQTNRPLVYVRDPLPGWSLEKTIDAYLLGNGRWTKVADVRWRVITDMAEAGPRDVVNLVTVADLGSGGALADQQLPNGSARILPMRMNSRVKWILTDGPMNNGIDAARVFLHEGGHFLDHQHWPRGAPPEVMEPVISDSIWTPQPTEAAVTAGWFGIPMPTPPNPPTPPGPTPDPFPDNCCFRLRPAKQALYARIPMELSNADKAKVEAAKRAIADLDCRTIVVSLLSELLNALAGRVCPPQVKEPQ